MTPLANTPDPQMITVGSQLELKPSRDHQEMVFAQLTLSDEGLFRIQARGPESIEIVLRRAPGTQAPTIRSQFGMDPEFQSVRLNEGPWYIGIRSAGRVTLQVTALKMTDSPPHNPPSLLGDHPPKGTSPQVETR